MRIKLVTTGLSILFSTAVCCFLIAIMVLAHKMLPFDVVMEKTSDSSVQKITKTTQEKKELTGTKSSLSSTTMAAATTTVSNESTTIVPKAKNCSSRQCKILSAQMFMMLNQDVDPCKNFEEFSCGGYRKQKFSGGSQLSQAQDITNTLNNMLPEMLALNFTIKTATVKRQKLYKLVRDTIKSSSKISKVANKDERSAEVLKEMNKIAKDVNTTLDNFEVFLARMCKYGRPHFLNFTNFSLTEPNLSVQLNFLAFFKHDDTQALISKIASINQSSALQTVAKSALKFVPDLVKIKLDAEDVKTNTSCTIKLTELKSDIFDWDMFTKEFKEFHKFRTIPNVEIELQNCNFTKQVLLKYKDKESFRSFLLMGFMQNRFAALLTSSENLLVILEPFRPIILDMFKAYYFPVKDENYISIIEQIVAAAKPLIEAQKWLDSDSKKRYLKSMQDLKLTFGHYKDMCESVVRYLETYSFDKNVATNSGFIQTIIEITAATFLGKLNYVKDKISFLDFVEDTMLTKESESPFYPLVYNAGNMKALSLYFAYGTYHPFLYSPTYPDYINLSGFGATAAHEIGHNLLCSEIRKLPLTKKSEDIFYKEKCKCVKDIYQLEFQNAMGVNESFALKISEATIDENIADVISDSLTLKAAFGMSGIPSDSLPRLPGFMSSYTPEQIYFIHKTQVFCSKFSVSAYMANFPKLEPHSPAAMRHNMTAKNSADFSRVFGCKVGRPMNPDRKRCVFI